MNIPLNLYHTWLLLLRTLRLMYRWVLNILTKSLIFIVLHSFEPSSILVAKEYVLAFSLEWCALF